MRGVEPPAGSRRARVVSRETRPPVRSASGREAARCGSRSRSIRGRRIRATDPRRGHGDSRPRAAHRSVSGSAKVDRPWLAPRQDQDVLPLPALPAQPAEPAAVIDQLPARAKAAPAPRRCPVAASVPHSDAAAGLRIPMLRVASKRSALLRSGRAAGRVAVGLGRRRRAHDQEQRQSQGSQHGIRPPAFPCSCLSEAILRRSR